MPIVIHDPKAIENIRWLCRETGEGLTALLARLAKAETKGDIVVDAPNRGGTALQRFKGSTYVPIHRPRGPVDRTSLCLTRPCRPKMCWTRELASSHDPY